MEANATQILETALTVPGTLSSAYRQFHGYSLRNQILAIIQCQARGLIPGPLATFKRWKELGRQVTKGQKALMLCQPRTITTTDKETGEKRRVIVGFEYRNRWFVLAQTEGEEYQPEPIPGWDRDKALAALDVREEPFSALSGNTMGYSYGRTFAVNPVCPHKTKTLMHELAHIVLGHTAEPGTIDHAAELPRNLAELEAEATALLVLEALDLPGADLCRGYCQTWYAGDTIPEENAERILTAADRILSAGTR